MAPIITGLLDEAPAATPASTPAAEAYSGAEIEVARIAVRVPPFWDEAPELWFARLETQFPCALIKSDEAKFATVVGLLDNKFLPLIRDILLEQAKGNRYETTKRRLVEAFSDSHDNRINRLMANLQISDSRPSDLWFHMKATAGNTCSTDFLRVMWTRRLPVPVQSALATMTTTNIKELTAVADRVFETQRPVDVFQLSAAPSASALAPAPATAPAPAPAEYPSTAPCPHVDAFSRTHAPPAPHRSSVEARLRNCEDWIASADQSMQEIKQMLRAQERRGPKNSNRGPHNKTTFDTCRFHQRYGNRSFRCEPPCSFKKAGNE
ncbi:uncharacterized protein LOC143917801 [Arctopsyche grandis]|uniref:uncharacterized protein LOC143915844 n=1 Tax=Arctopsyche grandis TaxID=121162 RepID=UPI00406D7D76